MTTTDSPTTPARAPGTVPALVRCSTCEHYRHTKSTERLVTVGLGSTVVGHPARHECLLMPQPVRVTPGHKCGQHTPNKVIGS